jgi:hypothetical protein
MVYINKEITINTGNYWLTALDTKLNKVIGTIRFSVCYLSPPPKVIGKSSAPFKFANVSAASGIYKHLENANVLMDFRKDIRQFHFYTTGSYSNKDADKYKQELIKLKF